MIVAAAAVWAWRRGRRIIAVLLGVVGVGAALVAMRDLPELVVVAVLLAADAAVGVVTAWPLLTRARRARSRTEESR